MTSFLNEIPKIAIGTAQYGMKYGVANKIGKIQDQEMRNILDFAIKNGINTIDTAMGYGDCEPKLGKLGVKNFNLITKITNLSDFGKNTEDFALKSLRSSIENLKVDNVNSLLLHNPNDLISKNKEMVYNSIQTCKKEGLCRKIGVSCYDVEQVSNIIQNFDIDIIQFPLNIFNTKLIDSGLIKILKKKNIEIHVRSIFLQGLLLMEKTEINSYFYRWEEIFNFWEEWLRVTNISKLQACLLFVFGIKEVDKIILGIDSLLHLQQILDILKNNHAEINPFALSSMDEDLINPSKWNLKQD
tara:strand:- start:27106 stop:28005 length:900 start_codon:yes stop_codon:yes gene_type:complete